MCVPAIWTGSAAPCAQRSQRRDEGTAVYCNVQEERIFIHPHLPCHQQVLLLRLVVLRKPAPRKNHRRSPRFRHQFRLSASGACDSRPSAEDPFNWDTPVVQ